MRITPLTSTRSTSRKLTVFTLAIGLSIAASVGIAAPSDCPENYAQGERPDILNERLDQHTVELCSPGHAVMYSGIARSPIWSAEHLTPGRLNAAREVPRTDVFQEDRRLPEDWRATLDDFRHSGYDRGHLAPSADMPTPTADAQSFLLSNIVAQDSNMNRSLWAAIEKAVRALARHREVYVITGALWKGANVERLKARVMVPTHLYKLVYDPANEAAAAYLVQNAPNKAHVPISLKELKALVGIDFYPGRDLKRLKLPRPRY